jgi:predicted GIY-YIG superfamily endonuclease
MPYYVYLLASQKNGTLYAGVTNDLIRRVYEHRNDLVDGFSKQHGVHRLVRIGRVRRGRNPERETDQVLETRVEGAVDPESESGMARLV